MDVLLRDGVVAAQGVLRPESDMLVVDADGRWLIPGLWDQHVHFTQWARNLTRLDLTDTASADEVVETVRRGLGDTSEAVVFGFGYRSAAWPRPGTVAELDAVTGERPVVLISGDVHNGWLNSAALQLLGIPAREDPLAETEWFSVFDRLESLPRDDAADAGGIRNALQGAAARGVVGITDMEFGRTFIDWSQRVSAGAPALRVRAATYPTTLDEVIENGWRTGDVLPGGVTADGRELVTMGPLKVITDGSLNTRTAYCCDPYADDPTSRGILNVPPAELVSLLARATAHGLTAAVHAIGDAAVASALDAFATTRARGSIEHAQLVQHSDVERMGRLRITASVQPHHLLDDRDVTQRCWPDRAERCFPLRSLLHAGVTLALGSDAPVAPLDPWLAMAAAVHRSGDDRPAWNPGEAITPAEALAASVNGQQTVRVGSPADLVLLESNPFEASSCNLPGGDSGQPVNESASRPTGDDAAWDTAQAALRLRETVVALTIVGGVVTHEAL